MTTPNRACGNVIDKREIERMLRQATPGPWVWDDGGMLKRSVHSNSAIEVGGLTLAHMSRTQATAQAQANAELMANAFVLARRVLELEAELETERKRNAANSKPQTVAVKGPDDFRSAMDRLLSRPLVWKAQPEDIEGSRYSEDILHMHVMSTSWNHYTFALSTRVTRVNGNPHKTVQTWELATNYGPNRIVKFDSPQQAIEWVERMRLAEITNLVTNLYDKGTDNG